MSTELNCKVFSECLHTVFHLAHPGGEEVALELISVTEIDSAPRQEQFSVMFRGPNAPSLKQQMHPLRHDKLGDLTLFLVPVGPDSEGLRYEAVFNRLRRDAPAQP